MIDYVLKFAIIYWIYESLSTFWKNSEKKIWLWIKHILTLDLLSPPSNFWGEKNTLIKEWSTHMHIEEQGTNFELKRAIFFKGSWPLIYQFILTFLLIC